MMRTTVDIPDDLLAQLRSISRDSGKTLSSVVVELMQRGIHRRHRAAIVKDKSGLLDQGMAARHKDVAELVPTS